VGSCLLWREGGRKRKEEVGVERSRRRLDQLTTFEACLFLVLSRRTFPTNERMVSGARSVLLVRATGASHERTREQPVGGEARREANLMESAGRKRENNENSTRLIFFVICVNSHPPADSARDASASSFPPSPCVSSFILSELFYNGGRSVVGVSSSSSFSSSSSSFSSSSSSSSSSAPSFLLSLSSH